MKGWGKYLAGLLAGLHLGVDALLILGIVVQQDRINALERRPIGHTRYSTSKRYTSYAEKIREKNKDRNWCHECKHHNGKCFEEPCVSCYFDSLGYRTNFISNNHYEETEEGNV